jgi:hypothetical protein
MYVDAYMDGEIGLVRHIGHFPGVSSSHPSHRGRKDFEGLPNLYLTAQLMNYITNVKITVVEIVSDIARWDDGPVEVGLGFDRHLLGRIELIVVRCFRFQLQLRLIEFLDGRFLSS